MCGITGFVQPDLRNAEQIIESMTGAIVHRGPDDSGCWTDLESGVVLGFRRLAILDLTQAGHQPMASASGRFSLVYNGEIYNYLGFRSELESKGVKFRGHSDTEAMLAAFEEWGVEAAIKRFDGMFAFVLWDRREKVLHLCRDRMGEKPLYYGWSKGTFLFGSELRALRAHPNFDTEIDRDALAMLLRFSYIPAPYSIYKQIRKLLPGHLLTLSRNDLSAGALPAPKAYWSAKKAFEDGSRLPFQGDDNQAVDALDVLLSDSVKSRMVSDVPLGAFLSGGIDSSTVVALMQKLSNRPVKTFTIGFTEKGFDEAKFAAQVAKHLGTEHTELYLSAKEMMNIIPKLPAVLDEPFADSSQIPTYLVSKLAREHVTVSLSGDGGDELFAGYERYRSGPDLWNKIRGIPAPLRSVVGSVAGLLAGSMPVTVRRKLDYLSRMLPARDFISLNELIHSYWQQPNSVVLGATTRPTIFSKYDEWPKGTDLVSTMQFCDTVAYLPDDILAKVDRASMAVSLESRVPLLNHAVVEFAAKLPLHLKVMAGERKWILRRVLERYVPSEMFNRPKMGFSIPIDDWLRTDLRDWAEDLLNESSLRQAGYFAVEPILSKWHEHRSGKTNWNYQLWSVLMFQAWLRNNT